MQIMGPLGPNQFSQTSVEVGELHVKQYNLSWSEAMLKTEDAERIFLQQEERDG